MAYTYAIFSKRGRVMGTAPTLIETRKKAIDRFLKILAKSPNHYDYIAIYSGEYTEIPNKSAYETIFVHGANPYSWDVDQVLDVYTYSKKHGNQQKGIVTRDGRLFKTNKITSTVIIHVYRLGTKTYKDYKPRK